MANIKQQRKRVRIASRERAENLRYKSRIKTMFRSLSVAAEEDRERAVQIGLELNSVIDKAASRGVIHANNAARKKAKVASIIDIPEGTAITKGPAQSEPKEGRSKAEKRSERNLARRTKKAEARASARARAEAAAGEETAEEAPVAEGEAAAETAEAEAAGEAPAEEGAAGEAPAEEGAAEEAPAAEEEPPAAETAEEPAAEEEPPAAEAGEAEAAEEE